MNMLGRFDKKPVEYHIIIGILVTLAIGLLNYWTGFRFRMEIFYLMPISYVTWFIGKKTGILLSTVLLITILCFDIQPEKYHYNLPTSVL
jgi:hypothetical protein